MQQRVVLINVYFLQCFGTLVWVWGRRRLSVFGHIARLTQGTLAHNALHCQVDLASGRSLGRDWRRRPGRHHVRWTDQLRNDTGSVPANLWRQTGHPWWSDTMAQAGYAMTTTTTTTQPISEPDKQKNRSHIKKLIYLCDCVLDYTV